MKITQTPSPNFEKRPPESPIEMVIIHYTDMATPQEALGWMCNPQSKVSAHYMIDDDGQVFQLVEETMRAWHAGASYWKGFEDINSRSIGIELSNPGQQFGYQPFPQRQIQSLISLCQAIVERHVIPAHHILGHSDIAPTRKRDPDYLFPWDLLAKHNLGLWPKTLKKPNKKFNRNEILGHIGYDISSPKDALIAFQRHFQPHKIDGIPDDETLTLLWQVRAKGLSTKTA